LHGTVPPYGPKDAKPIVGLAIVKPMIGLVQIFLGLFRFLGDIWWPLAFAIRHPSTSNEPSEQNRKLFYDGIEVGLS